MSKQQIFIVKSDSYEKEYADKLYNRIKTNYGDYAVCLWSEDEYKNSKYKIGDTDKIIFFGKARKIDDNAKDDFIRGKFNKFGMMFGWAGNICIIHAEEDKPSWSKFFKSFKEYCTEMNNKYSDVPIPTSNIFSKTYNNATRGETAGYRSQYSALLHEFLDGGGFSSFMAKANPESTAFEYIVEQLPPLDEFPQSIETIHWDTLENRSGYRIQTTSDNSNWIFRIITDDDALIAWGKRDYERMGLMAFLSLFDEKVISIADTNDSDNKSEQIYSTREALKPIEELLEDADAALGDKKRTLKDSSMSDVLLMTHAEVSAAFIGGALGFGMSFAVLVIGGKLLGLTGAAAITKVLAIVGGIVGGGMFAGIFVLAVPVAVLAAGGSVIVGKIKLHALKETKEQLLQKAVEKQQAILVQMKIEVDSAKQRTDYLSSLNEALRRAINDLRKDLGEDNA